MGGALCEVVGGDASGFVDMDLGVGREPAADLRDVTDRVEEAVGPREEAIGLGRIVFAGFRVGVKVKRDCVQGRARRMMFRIEKVLKLFWCF